MCTKYARAFWVRNGGYGFESRWCQFFFNQFFVSFFLRKPDAEKRYVLFANRHKFLVVDVAIVDVAVAVVVEYG